MPPSPQQLGETRPDGEYERAIWYGFLPEELVESDPESTVLTWAQYCDMLGRAIRLHDESDYPEWQKVTKRAPDKEMKRDGAMVSLLFAAKAMGYAFFNANTPAEFNDYAPKVWDVVTMDYPVFNWNTPIDLGDGCSDNNHVGPAYDFCLRRVSFETNKSLLEFDEKGDLRLEQPLTLRDAALSVIRLYESDFGIDFGTLSGNGANLAVQERVIGAEDQALLDAVEARKEAIRNSETTIKPTAVTYYISNTGNDRNDGRSPQTAWATIERLKQVYLEPGTTVLFERGGLWRGQFAVESGVTISAYGEGEKPRIYASPESGIGEEKWSLWYEEDGVKIWKYHRKLQDPGGIVMNDGEVYATRVFSYWDGTHAVFWENVEKDFDIAEALEHDLLFYCDYPDDIASREIPFYAFDVEMYGDVYLRCDQGNPGLIYESMEFQCTDVTVGFAGIIRVYGSDVTIDNLCLMYHHSMGISIDAGENVTVQNCEVGFVGGGSHAIGLYEGIGSGEGIRLDGYGNKAINNYVHNCFDGGILFEPDLQIALDTDTPIPEELLEKRWGNILIEGNVVERCNNGILIGVHCEDAVIPEIGPLTITDNDLLYSGYGWSGNDHYTFHWGNSHAITFWQDNYAHGTYLVENNRLYVAKDHLIQMGLAGENAPVFVGNTYAQNLNGGVLSYFGNSAAANSQEQVEKICQNILNDEEAVIPAFSE